MKKLKQNFKILVISDTPILRNYSIEKIKEQFGNIDFILSAGDLSNDYLDYIFTCLNKDLIYINGNHLSNSEHNIDFCKNIDQRVINYKGLRIMGFDGSPNYSYSEHQYSEFQVFCSILKNFWKLLKKKPDIVLSHSPILGIHDVDDYIHRGFRSYWLILKYFAPKLWVHGHIHLQHHHSVQESTFNNTKIVNAFGYKIIDFEV